MWEGIGQKSHISAANWDGSNAGFRNDLLERSKCALGIHPVTAMGAHWPDYSDITSQTWPCFSSGKWWCYNHSSGSWIYCELVLFCTHPFSPSPSVYLSSHHVLSPKHLEKISETSLQYTEGELRGLHLAGWLDRVCTNPKSPVHGKAVCVHQLRSVVSQLFTGFSMCPRTYLRLNFTRRQSKRIHVRTDVVLSVCIFLWL